VRIITTTTFTVINVAGFLTFRAVAYGLMRVYRQGF
jgi:hypothetical protein